MKTKCERTEGSVLISFGRAYAGTGAIILM